MKKFIIFLTAICVVWTFIVLPVSAALNPYDGVYHTLTEATGWGGKRHETMTVTNKEKHDPIYVTGVVEVYVKNRYASGAYVNERTLNPKKSVTINTSDLTNTNYGTYKYIIKSLSQERWGKSGVDW